MYAKGADGAWHCLLPPTTLMPNAHSEDGGQTLLSLTLSPDANPKAAVAPAQQQLQPPQQQRGSAQAAAAASPAEQHTAAWLKCRAPTAWETRRERLLQAQPLPAAAHVSCVALVLQQPSPKWMRYGVRAVACYGTGAAAEAPAPPRRARFPGELPPGEADARAAQALRAAAVPEAASRLRLEAAGARLGHMARAAAWLAAPLPGGALG